MRHSAHFAARLSDRRRRAGLTQHELARRAGVHQVTIANIELGRQEAGIGVALALADALGVPLDVLADGRRSRRKWPDGCRTLADLIAARRLDQQSLARASGVSTSQISRLVLGRQLPMVGTARRLAAALRVSLDDLAMAMMSAHDPPDGTA